MAHPAPLPLPHFVPQGYEFDVAYTSVLKRAIRTLWSVMHEMELHWMPVHRNWRLNERHYGALQGLNKAETAAKHGEEQVRRCFCCVCFLHFTGKGRSGDDDSVPHMRFRRVGRSRSAKEINFHALSQKGKGGGGGGGGGRTTLETALRLRHTSPHTLSHSMLHHSVPLQVKIWRRSYDIPPPPLETSDPRHPSHDRRYTEYGLTPEQMPATESLKETVARFLPAWHEEIAPAIRSGKRVLIAAHGNSLRALVQYLDGMSEKDILELNIPTAVPLVYELDKDLKPIKHYYLGDEAAIAAKMDAVAKQGTAAAAK